MSALRSAWHHIRRSPFQSFSAILIIWFCFFVSTFFFVISDGLSGVLSYFETKPEITIFLKDGLDKNTVESIQRDLSNYPDIREIKFISKDEALKIYQEQNKGNPLLLEMVTSSILPASFEVSVSNPETLNLIAENFSGKKDQVDEIIYQKDIIQSLLSALGLIAFLMIFVLIGMKITNRKDEVKISRLLGASRHYVKKPFLYEGAIYGLIGSSLGWLLAFIIIFYFKNQINQYFEPTVFINNEPIYYLQILFAEIAIGLFIGYLASWFGVKRYIKY
ncbi:MAG: Cell division protein [Candidatus Shapirobacteria bacterium GW2011_GWE1_38_92]|uniref:Cell division protein FtsX n=1 Tax=Candidatus Shapirobacteria bacterium GW2011_GWE1_38_92 TaxID=1618489 RepID=A0A0G0NYR2_9BACT|nr:MAG: Cell division protein [Candidatus Shapirobacteria bacterium GW2011_GWE1_38_92]